ncbi:MAG: PAS domain-containing protein, partial [Ignavibacteria bacterium]|nr:PAS domain-containing protein [Ignavibacteria bacterium]
MKNTISTLNEKNKLSAYKILDMVPGNLFVFDIKNEKLVYLKSTSDEHLAFSTEELHKYGTNLAAQLLHPEDKIVIGLSVEDLNNLPEGTVKELEIKIKDRSGKFCWFKINLAVFTRDDKNQITQIIGLFQNINESKITKTALEVSELSYRNLFNT